MTVAVHVAPATAVTAANARAANHRTSRSANNGADGTGNDGTGGAANHGASCSSFTTAGRIGDRGKSGKGGECRNNDKLAHDILLIVASEEITRLKEQSSGGKRGIHPDESVTRLRSIGSFKQRFTFANKPNVYGVI
ncbi:MAG: hypothetical protein JO254_07135 [Pseudolabrys sp.]|nr:hypothetical protein [Pseudolabrys sp.]